MKSDDHPQAEDRSRSASCVSEKRRKLLKASAAVAPLIGTLRSGAALANPSAYQCLAHDDDNTPPVQIANVPGHGSGWIEVEGDLNTYTAVYTGTGTLPDPPNTITVYEFEGRYFETDPGSPADFLDGSEEVSWPADAPSVPDLTFSHWQLTSNTTKFALKYFEPEDEHMGLRQGRVLTIVPNPGGEHWMALTGSCWSSLV